MALEQLPGAVKKYLEKKNKNLKKVLGSEKI